MNYKICPICALVVIAWIVGLVGIYTDANWISPLVVAMLMGGSVGALAEKFGSRLGMIWKSIMVIIGFSAAYFLATGSFWMGAVLGILVLLLVWYILKNLKHAALGRKDMFKDCC